MRDLGQVQSVLLELDENRYQLRTDMVGNDTRRAISMVAANWDALAPFRPLTSNNAARGAVMRDLRGPNLFRI
jgi:hypothetical protein